MAPPQGVIKINTDASLAVEGQVGIGAVAKDARGVVIFAATRITKTHWPVEEVEAKAIANAVKLGRRYGFEEVIIESDCQFLIS